MISENMKPTRIIKEPYYITVNKRARHCLECDNGKQYTVAEICAEVGIKRSTYDSRINRFHWSDEKILKPECPKGKRISEAMRGTINSGTPEWQKLSARPRTRNLEKIRNLTPIERQLF